MSSSNPSITVSDIITDVDGRISSANLSSSVYIPWVSYSYQRIYQALTNVGKTCAETLFGDTDTIALTTTNPNEYTITDEIPRFASIIAVWVKYGATGDIYNKAKKLRTTGMIGNPSNVSTTYFGKTKPFYYIRGGVIGFIPVPPESNGVAKIDFVKRPYQLTETTDVIDIPYRFIWPISEYVHAKAIQRLNEDYNTSAQLESNFRQQLEEVALAAASEFDEDEQMHIEEDPNGVGIDPLSFS